MDWRDLKYCYTYLHVYPIEHGWQAIWLRFDHPVPGWSGENNGRLR